MVSLRALSKNKAGHGGQWEEEGCVEVATLECVIQGLFLGGPHCTSVSEDASLFSVWGTERGHILVSR